MVKVGASRHTKLQMLWVNTAPDESHCGNLVTYLRIKRLVPPSTEGQCSPGISVLLLGSFLGDALNLRHKVNHLRLHHCHRF